MDGKLHLISFKKNSYGVVWTTFLYTQNLSIGESNFLLSLLEVGNLAAQTEAFFDKLQILASWGRLRIEHNIKFTYIFLNGIENIKFLNFDTIREAY